MRSQFYFIFLLTSTVLAILVGFACAQPAQYRIRDGANGTPVHIHWGTINQGGRTIYIPLQFQVELTSRNVGHSRSTFTNTTEVRQRMTDMNHRGNDEKGHIIASQLGGTADTRNLFPQSVNMNRNCGCKSILESWYCLERKMAEFLKSNLNRSVRYLITFAYRKPSEPGRPSDVNVTSQFYENNNQVDEYAGPFRNEDRPLCPKRAKRGILMPTELTNFLA